MITILLFQKETNEFRVNFTKVFTHYLSKRIVLCIFYNKKAAFVLPDLVSMKLLNTNLKVQIHLRCDKTYHS